MTKEIALCNGPFTTIVECFENWANNVERFDTKLYTTETPKNNISYHYILRSKLYNKLISNKIIYNTAEDNARRSLKNISITILPVNCI